ncbi:MAG: 5'/3'-nucleotidase SurE [Bacteroidia bacterium]|nr:5'/3'-nucleotidase SurE [Bacteroidia bacterium]
MKKPFILVTNDDGINAPGILYLSKIAKKYGDVAVIAPDKPQSGSGHAITIHTTLRILPSYVHHTDIEYAINGTPVDCVKLSVNKILPKKPDLILSGINHGSNSSINVIYSGTMSAAIEGYLEGIPSAGFSLCNYSIEADFSNSEKYICQIIEWLLTKNKNELICLNVNIPDLPSEEIRGIKICRQAKGNWVEDFEERLDPYNKPYYWMTGKFTNFEPQAQDTDEWALNNGYVSVVPIQTDLTCYQSLDKMKKDFLE